MFIPCLKICAFFLIFNSIKLISFVHLFPLQPLVKFKSHLYYEDKDKIQETLKNLRIAPGSKIEFFKNGQSQGVAFSDIYAGSYYPTISIHKSATVSVNFGPTFKYPEILTNYKAKGVSLNKHISYIHYN